MSMNSKRLSTKVGSRQLNEVRFIVFSALAAWLMSTSALAAVTTTFDFGVAPLVSDQVSIIRTTTLFDSGVTFDARLTVTGNRAGGTASATNGTVGSAINIGNGSGGIGVGTAASPLIAANQSLTFSLSILNVTGGNVNFDGFKTISFSSFNLDDSARLFSSSGGTLIGTVDFSPSSSTSTSLSPFAGSSFVLFGNVNADRNNTTTISDTSFRVSSLQASFSASAATAVPEPSTTALFSIACIGIVFAKRRSGNFLQANKGD